MKRKLFMCLGILTCTMFLFGCSTEKKVSDPEKQQEEVQQKQEEEKSELDEERKEEESIETPSYPSKDAGSIVYESPLGYSCTFDPTVFTLDDLNDSDHFLYQTAEKLDAPVYLVVQTYSDMSTEELANGIILQSQKDDVQIQETKFGAEGIPVSYINLEQDVNEVKQIQTFYFIPSESGSLLVEIGGYVGMPEAAEHKLEEITGTFSLND